ASRVLPPGIGGAGGAAPLAKHDTLATDDQGRAMSGPPAGPRQAPRVRSKGVWASMSPLPHPAPLAATAAALRSGERDLLAYIDEVCDRIDALEPRVQALLPEPDRR